MQQAAFGQELNTLQTEVAPFVSVLIITREREQPLAQCVTSVLESTYRNFEIVIIDNGTPASNSSIDKFITSLSTDILIRHFRVQPIGFAQLRQFGTEATKGDIIISVDDDCIIDSSNIAQIVALFAADPTIGIVGSNITNVGFKDKEQFKGRGKIGVNGRYEIAEDPSQADVFGSANMSFRRLAFERAGGYDQFFKGGLEEADLTYAIKRAGFRVVYAPHIHITHYHVPSRFRDHTRNMNTLRIYFYLKYFQPKSLREWIAFSIKEVRLCFENLEEIFVGHRQLIGPHLLKNIKVILRVAYLCWQVLIARLKVPYLLYIATKGKS